MSPLGCPWVPGAGSRWQGRCGYTCAWWELSWQEAGPLQLPEHPANRRPALELGKLALSHSLPPSSCVTFDW